jgi:hypothetical protein
MRRIAVIQGEYIQEYGRPPGLVGLWRTEPSDDGLGHYYQRFFSSEALRWKHGRDMGRIDYRVNYRSQIHPDDFGRSWGYIFDFADGTKGACMVRHVHLALAVLGARIDMDSEPSDERR